MMVKRMLHDDIRHLLWGFIFLLLAGCGASQTDDPEKPVGTKLNYISLISHKNFNKNTATTVDLLVVYDKKLYEYCKELSARSYLEKIDQIRRDNMNLVSIFRWEMVPSQVLEGYRVLIKDKSNVHGVLLFADYMASGHHRAAVESNVSSVRVHLGEKDIKAVEQGPETTTLKKGNFKVYPLYTTIELNASSPTQGQINQEEG